MRVGPARPNSNDSGDAIERTEQVARLQATKGTAIAAKTGALNMRRAEHRAAGAASEHDGRPFRY